MRFKLLKLFVLSTIYIVTLARTPSCSNLWKKGFFINNAGDTTFCLIKDENWRNNPIQFKWKNSINEDPRIASLDFVSLFQIDSHALFIRDTIVFQHESSKKEVSEIDRKLVFLKVLVEGEPSLYYYQRNSVRRFYYRYPKNSPLLFLREIKDQIDDRRNYRYQIKQDIDCSNMKQEDIDNLSYDKNVLVEYFIMLNQCIGNEYLNYHKFRQKGNLNFGLFLATYAAPSTLLNTISNNSRKYSLRYPWNVGFELEYLLPYWNKNWSIYLSPSIFKYGNPNAGLHYITIDINIAARRYIALLNSESLFLNAGLVLSYPISSKLRAGNMTLDILPSRNYILGIGYELNESLSLELRTGIDRDLSAGKSFPWIVKSNYFGLILHAHLF